jgi:cytochrome P450
VPRGAKVALLFGAANRDPRVFEDPDAFDVGRANASEHIGFGGGIHVCIGAPLARIELEAALRTLFERGPELELADEPLRNRAFVIWGLDRVEVCSSSATPTRPPSSSAPAPSSSSARPSTT